MQRSSLFLVLLVTACVSWRPEPTSPAELVANQKPNLVRITQSDSSRLILLDPRVDGDTLYGRPLANLQSEPEEPVGIPLAEVMGIETQRSDPTKTTLLVAGTALMTFSVLCLAEAAGLCEEETFVTAPNLGP